MPTSKMCMLDDLLPVERLTVLPACMTAALMQGFEWQQPQWEPASGVECTVQFDIHVSSWVLVGS